MTKIKFTRCSMFELGAAFDILTNLKRTVKCYEDLPPNLARVVKSYVGRLDPNSLCQYFGVLQNLAVCQSIQDGRIMAT
jgi:hypothetical protein